MTELQYPFLAYLGNPEDHTVQIHTVQMLFRLGKAEPAEHSARWPVEDLMRV